MGVRGGPLALRAYGIYELTSESFLTGHYHGHGQWLKQSFALGAWPRPTLNLLTLKSSHIKRYFVGRPASYYSNSDVTFHAQVLIISGDIELNPGPATSTTTTTTRPGSSTTPRPSTTSTTTCRPTPQPDQSQNVRIYCQNICSLKNKLDTYKSELYAHLLADKIDIVALNETWLNETVGDPELCFKDFSMFRRDS